MDGHHPDNSGYRIRLTGLLTPLVTPRQPYCSTWLFDCLAQKRNLWIWGYWMGGRAEVRLELESEGKCCAARSKFGETPRGSLGLCTYTMT